MFLPTVGCSVRLHGGLFISPMVDCSVRLYGQCHRCPPLRATGKGPSNVMAP
ncbi:hypothetical protein [Izhakiella australiensis]|uniref:hypothetical protein n=1 Tax=Izhakiella australiensis TaxID=1926881 RepID=UPI001590CA8A|nr:hypothetical protein [Izhakiella australiensis]